VLVTASATLQTTDSLNAVLLLGNAITIGGAFNLNVGTEVASSGGTNTIAAVPNFGAAEGVFVDNSAATLTVASAIPNSSTGGLTVGGGGTLKLNGLNAFTGTTTFNSGTLVLGNNSALSGGTLAINGGTLQAGVAGTAIANAITLNAPVTVSG